MVQFRQAPVAPILKRRNGPRNRWGARTVLLMPGWPLRSRLRWEPRFPPTRAAFCLFLCFRANQVISRPDRFDHDRTAIPTRGVVMDARRGSSAQLPEGVGRSRPLVSRTSGAGGASSPAMAGVISAGTEAIVGAGLAVR